ERDARRVHAAADGEEAGPRRPLGRTLGVSARRAAAVPVLAVVLALLAASARADAPAAGPAPATGPRLVVSPAALHFGTVRQAGEVQKEFVIRNPGRADLVIESISSDCGCTVARDWSRTVKPGGSTTMRVTLTAPADAGRIHKSLLIKSNDAARPGLEV